MNFPLVGRLLGVICFLIAATMTFSLPWAHPSMGYRNSLDLIDPLVFESRGFFALAGSVVISLAAGLLLTHYGKKADGKLYRKEAMAVVGLSWLLATVLGALPFYFAGVGLRPALRFTHQDQPQVETKQGWLTLPEATADQRQILLALLDAGGRGLEPVRLDEESGVQNAETALESLREESEAWSGVLLVPQEREQQEIPRHRNYRIRWLRMSIADALFESQSGFSTTGATVISDLEDPHLVPHCILFWRSSTHFLGGLGIIVLFVVILGQGSAGKALMRAEMPGPTKEGSTSRMQHTAWLFAAIYCALNALLALLLFILGLSVFDAFCHAFGTMATGGFSTYNASLGHFKSQGIEYTVVVFMVLAGTNFSLLYLVCILQPRTLFHDLEWRTYAGLIVIVTAAIVGMGLYAGDFDSVSNAIRYGLFQVVAIITTTGYGTNDFDVWNNFGRGILLILMFIGGCAGSTGGGMKVIRHILFVKILWLEIEQSYHPTVVRPLRLQGKPIEDVGLRKSVLVYFGLILILFVACWMLLVAIEPNMTWAGRDEHKLIDSASAIAATLNNIGPGLGTVGATQNYGHFSEQSKLLFVWLMMLGRLELFPILVLSRPNFWRSR